MEEPESRAAHIERVLGTVGFFWMIAAANVKNLLNGDLSEFHRNLLWLDDSIREVQAGLRGRQPSYISHTHSLVYVTSEERVVALRQRCDEMEQLMPDVVKMGGYVPINPRAAVEKRLDLLMEA